MEGVLEKSVERFGQACSRRKFLTFAGKLAVALGLAAAGAPVSEAQAHHWPLSRGSCLGCGSCASDGRCHSYRPGCDSYSWFGSKAKPCPRFGKCPSGCTVSGYWECCTNGCVYRCAECCCNFVGYNEGCTCFLPKGTSCGAPNCPQPQAPEVTE